MKNKKDLTGKLIIAFDTICDGWQCSLDEQGNPDPNLYDSEADAMFELFGDAISMLENQTPEDRSDNEITEDEFSEMKTIFADGEGDTEHMKNFLDTHPNCNYSDEFIIPAEEFVFGCKAIFTGKGVVIKGNKL